MRITATGWQIDTVAVEQHSCAYAAKAGDAAARATWLLSVRNSQVLCTTKYGKGVVSPTMRFGLSFPKPCRHCLHSGRGHETGQSRSHQTVPSVAMNHQGLPNLGSWPGQERAGSIAQFLTKAGDQVIQQWKCPLAWRGLLQHHHQGVMLAAVLRP